MIDRVLVLSLMWPAVVSVTADASADPPPPVYGSGVEDGFGVTSARDPVSGLQSVVGPEAQREQPRPVVRVVDCGPMSVEGRPVVAAGACSVVHPVCDVASTAALPRTGARNYVVVTTDSRGSQTFAPECNVPPSRARPRVTGELARAAAERLLPHPDIGTAPSGGATLVNIETVLWVDTPPDVVLGTVRLLGFRVTLRAHLEGVWWRFGDGVELAGGAGRAYSVADPCRTAQCPGYFGHTYRRTGRVWIGAQLRWSGQFRVEGGAWQDIPGTVSAAATGRPMHVREARGVLVDNP